MAEIRTELKTLIRLSAPVVVAQLGIMMLGVVDLMMVGHLEQEGRVGAIPLSAANLGRLWAMGTLIFGMGCVFGIDPIVSQGHGARDRALLGLTLQRGLLFALLISIPIAGLWLLTEDVLVAFGQDPHLASLAADFVLVQLPGLPMVLLFHALRQYLQGRGIVAPATWIVVLANLLNVLGNWVLIFGHWGFPAMGLVGAGLATAMVQVFMFFGLLAWVLRFRLQRAAWTGWSREALRPAGLIAVFKLGAPIALQLGLEMWAFAIATLMAGWLGKEQLAAHTVVINLASLSFMVPLGISIGTTTRVGNLIGANKPDAAQRAAWVALALAAVAMSGFAIAFILLRATLPRWYTPDRPIAEIAGAMLPIAAAFQLFDGTQVVGGGILRAMGRTRPAVAFNAIGYYLLGLPLGYWLAFRAGRGLAGVWFGLALGLLSVAALLLVWIRYRGPARVASRIV